MSRPGLTTALALIACSLGVVLASGAGAALVAVNSLILRADGGFQPRDDGQRR